MREHERPIELCRFQLERFERGSLESKRVGVGTLIDERFFEIERFLECNLEIELIVLNRERKRRLPSRNRLLEVSEDCLARIHDAQRHRRDQWRVHI